MELPKQDRKPKNIKHSPTKTTGGLMNRLKELTY